MNENEIKDTEITETGINKPVAAEAEPEQKAENGTEAPFTAQAAPEAGDAPRRHLTSAERQQLYMEHASSRISAERQNKKTARRNRTLIAVVSGVIIAVLIVTLTLLFEKVWSPAMKYNSAQKLYDSTEFLQAYDAFTALGDYSDAAEMAHDCLIENAKKLAGRDSIVIGFTDTHPWFKIDKEGIISFDSETYVGESAVIIPDVFDGVLVRGIADKAFYYCDFLTDVTIPPSVTRIGERSFFCCTSLTEVSLPDSLEVIGEYAFSGCTALESVKLGTGLKTVSQRAFRECSSLKEIIIPEGTTAIGFRAFNGCTSLESVTLPSTLETIGGFAFTECNSLKSVTFAGTADRLVSILAEDGKEMLLNCEGLVCTK